MIIAIDGPAGSGKSTIAKILADRLQFKYINTGAMYRAVARQAQVNGVDLNDEIEVAKVAETIEINFKPGIDGQQVLVDGEDATPWLKSEKVGRGAAVVASQPKVRQALTSVQRQLGRLGNIVMEGRDIGTQVFPNANKKFYFHADPEERGRRRFLELKAKGADNDLQSIIDQIKQRDHEDSTREIAPLVQADDAIFVDTTHKTIEDLVELVMQYIEKSAND